MASELPAWGEVLHYPGPWLAPSAIADGTSLYEAAMASLEKWLAPFQKPLMPPRVAACKTGRVLTLLGAAKQAGLRDWARFIGALDVDTSTHLHLADWCRLCHELGPYLGSYSAKPYFVAVPTNVDALSRGCILNGVSAHEWIPLIVENDLVDLDDYEIMRLAAPLIWRTDPVSRNGEDDLLETWAIWGRTVAGAWFGYADAGDEERQAINLAAEVVAAAWARMRRLPGAMRPEEPCIASLRDYRMALDRIIAWCDRHTTAAASDSRAMEPNLKSDALESNKPVPVASEFDHSPDFRSVRWQGQTFIFTARQAHCVQLLWEAHRKGTPDVGGQRLLDDIESDADKLSRLFQKHEAWNTLIVSRRRGVYRLALAKEGEDGPQ